MTHQTIRKFSPFLIPGLLLGLSSSVDAKSVQPSIADAPTLPAIPLPQPDFPGTSAPAPNNTQEELTPSAVTEPESVPTSEAPLDTSEENTGGAETEAATTDPNIVDIASQNPDSFSIFLQALEASGLKDSLLERQDLTVFIPTNAAFESLPEGVLTNLLREENQQLLAKIMAHHVLEGVNPSSNLQTQDVVTLAESKAAIKVEDSTVNIDQAKVLQADISSSNGMVHVIDQVLIPAEIR